MCLIIWKLRCTTTNQGMQNGMPALVLPPGAALFLPRLSPTGTTRSLVVLLYRLILWHSIKQSSCQVVTSTCQILISIHQIFLSSIHLFTCKIIEQENLFLLNYHPPVIDLILMTLCMKFSWIGNVVFCSVKYPEKGPFKCDDDSTAPMGIPGDVKQAFKMNYTYSVTWEVLNMNERKKEYHNQFICNFCVLD